MPTDEELQQAYVGFVYALYAKDATSQAFKSGYRLGYIKANEKKEKPKDKEEIL